MNSWFNIQLYYTKSLSFLYNLTFMFIFAEKLEVPMAKRSKFVGMGGYNIKKLRLETGKGITLLG